MSAVSQAWTRRYEILVLLAFGGLATGGLAWSLGRRDTADLWWLLVTAGAFLPAAWWVLEGLWHHRVGSDVIAVLALAGTVAVREYLAGAVIAVMLTGGRLLEQRAGRRARRDLSALLSLAPRIARRHEADGIVIISAADVRPGDLLLVAPGEVVPVDGLVERGRAVLDEATITGEPLPAEHDPGDEINGGTVNAGRPFDLRAVTDADSSTYAGIVRMTRMAAAESSPFVRLADRYAAFLLPMTLMLGGLAWFGSGDPVRAVAVLVVATPCPLILAAPIAFVSGLSRCARRGVVVKGGDALERLARAHVLLFDKTGTVTAGRPDLVDILTRGEIPALELLRLVASLDQASPHVLASAIVRGARERDLSLSTPAEVHEEPGQGVSGRVEGHKIRVGKVDWAGTDDPTWAERARARAAARGAITVFVGIDGRLAGVLLLRDRIRPDAARTFRLLRRAGIDRAIMVTGDRAAVAASVAESVGADAVHAEQTPEAKVAVVRAETARMPTVMVGDGVNDAPALAAAGVGVALGARGATVSSEAADVVITVDRLERLAETLAIARRTRDIARQSAVLGMGLSLGAMVIASFGYLVPVLGALLQEVIDVVAILNALRALGPGRERWPRLRGDEAELVRALSDEHRLLWPRIERLPGMAEVIAEEPRRRAQTVAELRVFLGDLAVHERKDERLLYPAVADALGGADPTGAMSRGHVEISELARRIDLLCAEAMAQPRPAPDTLRDLRRAVQELHAVLRLHFAQEEENFFVLADEPRRTHGRERGDGAEAPPDRRDRT